METKKDKLSVVIGTYHCSVAQFDFDLEVGTCERRWVDDSATKSITSIKFNGFFCIYGGNDELVRIVNVAANKNVGALQEHQGSITHIETYENSHLFSSSDDGKIYIWQIGGNNKHKIKGKKHMSKSWECLCCMHNCYNNNNESSNNSKILSFSIHPSGRLMLSIDSKHNMKIWDLIRVKCIITIKMPKPAIDIQWSPNGYNYAIIRENKVLIYKNDGILYKVIKPTNKLNTLNDRYKNTIVSFIFITYDMICIADMSSRIIIYDIDTKIPLFTLLITHQNNINNKPKIKNLKVSGLNNNLYLISADNKGKICIWNIHECLNRVINDNDNDNKNENDYIIDENGLLTFEPLIEVDTETHITCMDVGIVGKLNKMYKWKKPKIINDNNNKMSVDEMINEANDSDDETIKQIKNRKKRIKKKKKKKKQKIDLSRFD